MTKGTNLILRVLFVLYFILLSNSAFAFENESILELFPQSPIFYGQSSQFLCVDGIGNHQTLYVNNLNVTNENNISLLRDAGDYNVTCAIYDEFGVLINFTSQIYSITKATSVTTVVTSPDIFAWDDEFSNIYCQNNESQISILYINGENQDTQQNILIKRSVGIYEINCSFDGNENYYESSSSQTYEVLHRVQNSQGDINDWKMQGRNLNHSAWDGIAFPVLEGMNYIVFQTGGFVESSPAVANGFVYVGSRDFFLYKLNASNINQVIANVNISSAIDSSPAVVGGFVYVADGVGNLYQLDETDLSIVSTFSTGNSIYASPVVGNGFVYVADAAGNLYQLDALDISRVVSFFQSHADFYSSPAITNNYVYIGSGSGIIYQLDALNVSSKFSQFQVLGGIYSSLAVANDFVYVATGNGDLLQLSATNVSILISHFNSSTAFYSAPAIANDFVIIAGENGVVYQFNATDVSVMISNYTINTSFYSSPSIGNNSIYIGDTEGYVHQLNLLNLSEEIALFQTQGGVFTTPAVAGGYIYFGSDDGFVYQLNSQNISLENYDVIPPSIQFENPTEVDGSIVTKPDVIVNITAIDNLNLTNITINLYDSLEILIESRVFETSAFQDSAYVDFYGLTNGETYMFNATACDSQNQCSSTETRTVSINASLSSQGDINSWSMWRRDLNHSGWDGLIFPMENEVEMQIFPTLSLVESSPSIANGFVYIGSDDFNFYKLDASNISNVIEVFEAGSEVWSSPAIVGDYVYVGTANGTLFQFDAQNISNPINTFQALSYIWSSPIVANGFVYVGSDDFNIYQLNATNISQLISVFTTQGEVWSTPAVAGEYLYVGSNDFNFYQLNASNISQEIARFRTDFLVDSSPSVDNGYVYVGGENGILYQLSAENVSVLISQYETGGGIYSSPAVSNGFVYVGSNDFNFYQLNASDVSQLINVYATNGAIWSSPTIAGDYVYVGSNDFNIYQLNATDVSSLIAIYSTSSNVVQSSPASTGRYLYIGSNDYNVYQFFAANISFDYSDFNSNIWFEANTDSNFAILNRNYVVVNVSSNNSPNYVVDEPLITVMLYNSNYAFIASNESNTNSFYLQFNNLSDGMYYFNATVCYIDDMCNITLTRSVLIRTSTDAGSPRSSSSSRRINTCSEWSTCSNSKRFRICTLTGREEETCESIQEIPQLVLEETRGKSSTFVSKIDAPVNIPRKLFDIDLRILKNIVNIGDDLSVIISLLNIGVPGETNATLYFEIKKDNAVVFSQREIVLVQTQEEYIKTFNLSSFEKGAYTLFVELTYEGQNEPASAQGDFEIQEHQSELTKIFETLITQTNSVPYKKLILPLEILLLCLTIFFAYRFYSRNIRTKN